MSFNISYITNEKLNIRNIDSEYKEHTFLDSATSPSNGTDLLVKGYSTVLLTVKGTGNNIHINFYGTLNLVDWFLVQGVDVSTGDVKNSYFANGGLKAFQFDVRGLKYFRVRLEAAENGTATVKGAYMG